MNPIGVHALVWAGGWSPDEARSAIAATAAAGYDLIEIPLLDPATIDVAMTRGLLIEYGLQASCSLGLDFETDVSSDDPIIVQGGLDRLNAALDVVVGIGANYLGGVLYSALGKYQQPATAAGRVHAVVALKALAERAAEDNVTIGLEVVNRYESNLINTAEQAMVIIEAIDASNVVVHLDTYHMNIEEKDFASPVQTCGDRLGYVHIGESNRGYPGTGTINWTEFFTALRAANYTGPVTFESFSSQVVHPTLSNMLGVWRNLWSDSDDLARKSLSFIRRGLTDPAAVAA